jgi:hypothetical protein
MTLIVTSRVKLKTNDPQVTLKKGHIGYINYVTAETLTASSEAAGFEVDGLANPLTFDRWKPDEMDASIFVDFGTAKDFDYIGLASHTLATVQAVATASYSTDGITYIDIADVSVGDNKPIMMIFPTIKARYVKIVFTGTTAPSLGVLFIGPVLTVERGFYGGHTPITMGRKTNRLQNKTEGGQYAGVSIITEGVTTSVEWKHLGAVWYRQNFEPFVIYARNNPFFFAWRNLDFPAEVGYVWVNGDIRPSNMGIRDLMEVSMNLEGFSDE